MDHRAVSWHGTEAGPHLLSRKQLRLFPPHATNRYWPHLHDATPRAALTMMFGRQAEALCGSKGHRRSLKLEHSILCRKTPIQDAHWTNRVNRESQRDVH